MRRTKITPRSRLDSFIECSYQNENKASDVGPRAALTCVNPATPDCALKARLHGRGLIFIGVEICSFRSAACATAGGDGLCGVPGQTHNRALRFSFYGAASPRLRAACRIPPVL